MERNGEERKKEMDWPHQQPANWKYFWHQVNDREIGTWYHCKTLDSEISNWHWSKINFDCIADNFVTNFWRSQRAPSKSSDDPRGVATHLLITAGVEVLIGSILHRVLWKGDFHDYRSFLVAQVHLLQKATQKLLILRGFQGIWSLSASSPVGRLSALLINILV